jgi:4-amino-4-deoxy-L-arabinose transferase-like glycosyltransferase
MKKILGAILTLGLVYRILFLGRRQLWTDELIQALVVRATSASELLRQVRDGMYLASPLDPIVQRGFAILLGESPWVLRFHAALFGALSIWLFYRLALLLFEERVALYSTALFAFYPLHQHYSQEAGPFALLTFLSLAAYDLLVRISQGGPETRSRWFLLSFVYILLLYASPYGLAVVASQGVVLILAGLKPDKWTDRESEKGNAGLPAPHARSLGLYAAAVCIAIAAYSPWLWFAWRRPLLASISEVTGAGLILRLVKEVGDNSYAVTALLLLGLATGVAALRLNGRIRTLAWLLAWPASTIAAVLVFDIWTGYFFAIRQILPATPPLILIAGYGVAHVGERMKILDHLPYRLSSPSIVYVLVLAAVSLVVSEKHWRKEPVDWKGAAGFSSGTVRPGDSLAAPVVYPLLEYHAPALESYRTADLDPGAGLLATGEVKRRVVVCYNGMKPDPCAHFRPGAVKSRDWTRRDLPGFTIFIRDHP